MLVHMSSIIRGSSRDGFRGIVVDLTEQRRMEADLRRTHNLESLGVLAGGIAHDFNNVMTGVTGNLSLLSRMLSEGSEEREIAEEAHDAAVRTKGLTQQLMTFAGGGAPVRESASMEELVRRTTELTLRGSNTKAAYDFEEGLSRAEVDVGQMGQVMQNLVMNADQAMPNGGVLRIGAEAVEIEKDVELPLSPGRYVKVTVCDEGVGIPEKVLPQVFDPYFTTKTAGHGLGLSICHSIVERHGGHIGVRSEVGRGTTFTVHVPASDGERAGVKEPRLEAQAGTGRVLVMDDEATVRRATGRMLKRLGYEVAYAEDGEGALAAYREAGEAGNPYDLVIMDLTIPGGMGGKEAVSKLRELDPQARVIVASGYSNDPVMSEPARYGFLAGIGKPIGLDELASAVASAIAGH